MVLEEEPDERIVAEAERRGFRVLRPSEVDALVERAVRDAHAERDHHEDYWRRVAEEERP
jgi:hypothetical protein